VQLDADAHSQAEADVAVSTRFVLAPDVASDLTLGVGPRLRDLDDRENEQALKFVARHLAKLLFDRLRPALVLKVAQSSELLVDVTVGHAARLCQEAAVASRQRHQRRLAEAAAMDDAQPSRQARRGSRKSRGGVVRLRSADVMRLHCVRRSVTSCGQTRRSPAGCRFFSGGRWSRRGESWRKSARLRFVGWP
jgi:hypothetical protein